MSQTKIGAVPRAPEEAALLLGGFSSLWRQLGSPDSASPDLGAALSAGEIRCARDLRDFLAGYQARILAPLEMPAIARACFHSARGRVRELIALDQDINQRPIFAAFASASRRIGKAQLERMRPLRDERTVQRYLTAVDSGHAEGWHTLVYGLTLAVYSLPLREGLLNYSRETLAGLARAASRPRIVSELEVQEILASLFLRLPGDIEQTVAGCFQKKENRTAPAEPSGSE